jgi:hypothetical protein
VVEVVEEVDIIGKSTLFLQVEQALPIQLVVADQEVP